MEVIEKCPECGSEASVVEVARGGLYHVCCSRRATKHRCICGLYGGYCDHDGQIKWFDSEEEAIKDWNERAREERNENT